MNLVVNASDALRKRPPPGGGRVLLSLERQGDWQVACVDDDGPGIDPAALERIFDEFTPPRSSRRMPRAGSGGIGLGGEPAHRRGVWRHPDRRSEPSGGARMTLKLPVAAGQRLAARPTGPIA